jgi:hypothetical protein
MTGALGRGLGVALGLALGLVVLGPAVGITEPAVARSASTKLALVTDATYTVHPDAGVIGVSVAIEARNRTSETRTKRYYYDHAFLAVQPGATGIHLAGRSGAKATVSRRTSQATLLRIDFGARLWSGKTATFRLTFDLPGRGPEASPQVRVGSSLVTIPVWAFASNGVKGSTVTVRFPAGWQVAVESGSFPQRSVSSAGTVLGTGRLGSPLTFFAFVSGQRPAVYSDTPRTVAVGDAEVRLVLRGWKDDPAWIERTGTLFDRALPVLREQIGLPWPMDDPIVVEEAVSRDPGGYAGLFDATEHRMEVAYWADHAVVIHQAAHGWFNGHLLGERWANEGFATYYALHAAATLKEPGAAPEMTARAQAAALPLNEWSPGDGTQGAQDDYGYSASLQLATAVADAVGPDVLAGVWADAASGIGAYQPPITAGATGDATSGNGSYAGAGTGDAATEGVEGVPDWRGLLDLLEERSGEDLVGLWRQWVVTPAEDKLLDDRAAARRVYHQTLAIAGDWQLPRPVRDALRAWQFDTAAGLMADARSVLAQRNAVEAVAARQGVTLPVDMRDLFEAGDLADASARAQAEQATLDAIVLAASDRTPDGDILSRIGMIGEHPERDLAAARVALGRGDIPASAKAAARAHRAWTAAGQEGRRRALLGIAVLATIVILTGAAIAHVRRTRAEARAPRPTRVRRRGDGPATA